VSDQVYNELFTMHGTIMLLLFATPLFVGFANEIMPQLLRRTANPTRTGDPDVRVLFTPH
jgi:heme/copper-type cytochrome/quinol oxidase subunit 1